MHLGRLSGPNHLLKKVTQSQFPRAMSRQLLSNSRDGDFTASLGSLCQCLVILMVKKQFQMFRCSLICFHLCGLPLVLTLCITENVLTPSSLFLSIRYLNTSVSSLLSLLFSRLDSPSSLRVSSQERSSGPLIVLDALCWTNSTKFISFLQTSFFRNVNLFSLSYLSFK